MNDLIGQAKFTIITIIDIDKNRQTRMVLQLRKIVERLDHCHGQKITSIEKI